MRAATGATKQVGTSLPLTVDKVLAWFFFSRVPSPFFTAWSSDYANYYQGLWDCPADEPDELAFQRGDLIYVISKVSISLRRANPTRLCPLLPESAGSRTPPTTGGVSLTLLIDSMT